MTLILARVGLNDCEIAHIMLETNLKLTPLDCTPLSDVTLYRKLFCILVYYIVIRPYIA